MQNLFETFKMHLYFSATNSEILFLLLSKDGLVRHFQKQQHLNKKKTNIHRVYSFFFDKWLNITFAKSNQNMPHEKSDFTLQNVQNINLKKCTTTTHHY